MGGEEAVTGFPFPPLSLDSPVLRRGEEVTTRARAPLFPFFLLKCGSDATGASSFSPYFLNSEKSFGSTLRGFDAEKGKHSIASRAS